MVNKPKGESEVCNLILDNHYDWCEKEGRDTSWYRKYWRKIYVETPKLLRKNKKRKSLDK